ncbi:hypothetical protein HHI36_021908 [Cryptolaemus montrouzieri]|uniref:Mutator-like transposase domain-containing protein n=1 Tax=Cryptolaemus montrouzieri TaxID=559131 RepID=A0ABD2MY54_9CUCU
MVVWICPECGVGNITTTLGKLTGWAVQVVITCVDCGYVSKVTNSPKVSVPSRTGGNQEVYNVNLRLVHGMQNIGKGMSAAEEFSAVKNMHRPPKFNKYEAILNIASENVCKESIDTAKEEAVA